MKHNKFTKKLLRLAVGASVLLKKRNGTIVGEFIRVPSGWVYKYTNRRETTCCFIPYTDEIQHYVDDLYLCKCINCNSANIHLHHNEATDTFFVRCDDCMAQSGMKKDRDSAIALWNKQN